MNRYIPPICATRLTLAVIGCVVAGGPVAAQTVSEVTVEAPRSVTTPVDRNTYPSGAQVEVTTIKVGVSYADLDLAKSADVAVLQSRIKAAASDACKQLDKLYPLQPDENCLRKAVVTATAQVEAAISGAGK